MKLSIKQARQIKNLVAFTFGDVSYTAFGKDKTAWLACDIPTRTALNALIAKIRLEVSND